ncbi:hypothetical protein [Petropleomorpha daqingensis]|uniref:Uncharacterized protein n=1 Tax=Petropleomorpha daqingensis TaxID=2026353 RepID=A0A853CFY3_9ACTN|nr:hypothetical protein [Petropleomorpha daqingensis]NYJ05909.1 hypothetical protein [Petropleomorpha daqingensis]
MAPLAAGFALIGIAFAPSAAAADDPARPDYAVVSGPSCHPGGVEIRVVDGTVPYTVVLASTRQPDGEDSADLAPGETVLLHTGDVDWGETIDSRLVFTARDGSGATFTDELQDYSFTRPAQEDCAAIAPSLAGVTDAPATVPASSGDRGPQRGDLQVRPAAASQPVAPVNRPPDWALIAAGVSLAGVAGGFAFVATRRRDTPSA